MSKKFWKLTNAVDSSGSTLYLEGPVASDSWWGDEVTPQDFRNELKSINSSKLTVVINSLGGDVWAGVSIFDALKELEAEVTVKVSGVAASIASVIAMAGDKIVMTPGSTMMIHRASMLAMGNAEDFSKAIEMLETVEEGIVNIYVERTGNSVEAVKEMLDAETWMSADKAVELGFADEVAQTQKQEAGIAENITSANFAFSMTATRDSLESFAKKLKNESDATETKTETTVEEVAVEESVDETQTEEVKTESTESATVEEEINNTAEKETSEMPKNNTEEIAQSQVMTPENQATVEVQVPTNYLKSTKSVEDFAKVLQNNIGKSAADVKNAWREVVIENGITNPDVLDLPEPLVTEIKDAMERSRIFNLLNHTGLDSFKVMWDTTDLNTDTSRAGQHNPGDTKAEQVLTFDDRTLEADFIYKYLVLDKKTVRQNRGSGALLRFVMRELPARIVREMERAAIIGDGRDGGDDRHITSFIAVKTDVQADNTFATSYTAAGESAYEAVARAADLLRAEGEVYLIAKRGFATQARFETDTDGKLLFPVGTRATDIFDVAGIIEPDWFNDLTDPDFDAYLVVLSAYKTVGDNSIESFTNFKLETNENEYLQEIYKGGGLSELKAAVGIATSYSS